MDKKWLQAEQVLRQIILKDLTNKGRKGYDRPHTEAVVKWMNHLLEVLPGDFDRMVLLTAAYAHDWGYADLFHTQDSRSFENIIANKAKHMQIGAQKIEALLYSRLGKLYTEAQKLQIVHLVSIHDKVRVLRTEDELLLMEADTLGMLGKEHSSSTLSEQDTKKFLETSIYNLRLPRFIHTEAKDIAEQLLDTYFT